MLQEPTLRLLEVAGQWVSGVGALAAVVVALYLARKQEAVRLRVSAEVRLLVERGSKETPRYVWISVVNLGHRPVTVSAIHWRIGLLRKQYFYQILDGKGELAGAIFSLERNDDGNFEPSRSQRVGIQRALKKLAEAGIIHQLNRWIWGTHAHRAGWEEEHRPRREYREALRSVRADMELRYGLRLSHAEADKLFEKHSVK